MFLNLFFCKRFAFLLHHGFVYDFGCWGIMLETSLFSKSSWRNSFPLLKGCCSFFFSIGLDVRTSCGCSLTIGCYNSPYSIGLNVEIDYNVERSLMKSWGVISTSSSEFEIIITCGASFVIEVKVFLHKVQCCF